MKIVQGEIYWVDLNPTTGHEQAGYRPVLVVQNNILNKHLNTVIIAPITKNLQAKGFLTTYFLDKEITFLPQDSIALLYQIRTLDKQRLMQKVSCLSSDIFHEIKKQTYLLF